MPFKHDSRGIDADKKSTILVMSDGWYTFKIREAEEQTSKKGNDMIFCKCVPVNEPQYEDAEIRHWVTFIPKGQPGDFNSVLFRKAIGVPYGGDDLVDAEDWIGKKFEGYVITEDYKNDDGDTFKRNKIKYVRPVGGEKGPVVGAKKKSELAEVAEDDVPF